MEKSSVGHVEAAPARKLARDKVLRVAADLFYRKGIRAVGVEEIVKQAGVAKISLYRNFESKDDLVVAYLEGRNRRFLAPMGRGICKIRRRSAGSAGGHHDLSCKTHVTTGVSRLPLHQLLRGISGPYSPRASRRGSQQARMAAQIHRDSRSAWRASRSNWPTASCCWLRAPTPSARPWEGAGRVRAMRSYGPRRLWPRHKRAPQADSA